MKKDIKSKANKYIIQETFVSFDSYKPVKIYEGVEPRSIIEKLFNKKCKTQSYSCSITRIADSITTNYFGIQVDIYTVYYVDKMTHRRGQTDYSVHKIVKDISTEVFYPEFIEEKI